MSSRFVFKFACLSLCLLVLSALTFGQGATASSTLSGTVEDKSGAVISGAGITITDPTTGYTRSTTTTDSGNYRFDVMPPGLYNLSVTKSGFSATTVKKVELIVSRTTTQNVTLAVGSTSEVVQVNEEAPLLDQQKTSVGLEIRPSDIQDLPLNGRDVGNLAYLAPGVRAVTPYDPTKQRYAVFAVNGSNGRNVNVTVNGTDNKDNTVGGPVMQLPLGAVQEFNISTQRFSAANGRSEGAAVNVITKSGKNTWHGEGYVFDTETDLNAIDSLTVRSAATAGKTPVNPQFSRQQFGGSGGGAIIKDKDFIFGALERDREHTANPLAGSVLSEVTLLAAQPALCSICVQPQPAAAIPTPYFDWRYNGRVDHTFNNNHHGFFSYTGQTNLGNNDQAGISDLTGGNFTKNELIIANVTVNSVLSPRFVNAASLGYQYWNNLIDTATKVPTVGFPFGAYGTNTNVPQQSYQKKWQYRDDMSYNLGAHGFKWGVDFVHVPTLGGFFEFTPTLAPTFYDNPSKILADKVNYPQGFSTPGAVQSLAATAGDPKFNLPGGAKMLGLYFQDDWKASSRLTLNLGMRYDRDFNLYGTSDASTNRVFLQLKKIGNPFGRDIPRDDTKDFSPRLGFAYDLTGKGRHIVRGGYGLYFGQTFLNIPLFMIQESNPTLFATVLNIAGAGAPVAGVGPACSPATCTVPGAGKTLATYRFGVDPLPTIPPPPTDLVAGSSGRWIDPGYKNPYSQQWNLGYAFQLDSATVIEVDAVHELALRESKGENINPIVCPLPCQPATSPFGPSAINPSNAKRALADAFAAAGIVNGPGRLTVERSNGRSRYDGLNVSFRRRMSHRFSVISNYTLSRAVGYRGSAGAFGNAATIPSQPYRNKDFGALPNDELHHFSITSVVDLPWGFQVAPILQAASGRPFNATSGLDIYNSTISGVTAPSAFVLATNPNNLTALGLGRCPSPVAFSNRAATDNSACSAAELRECLVATTCQESHFDQVRGQAYFQLDTRVTKNFKFKDRANLKLIFQGFDLTNRANFGNNFTTSVRSAAFGQPAGYITGAGVIIPKAFRAEFGAQFTF